RADDAERLAFAHDQVEVAEGHYGALLEKPARLRHHDLAGGRVHGACLPAPARSAAGGAPWRQYSKCPRAVQRAGWARVPPRLLRRQEEQGIVRPARGTAEEGPM